MSHKQWEITACGVVCRVYLCETQQDMVALIDYNYNGQFSNPDGGAFSCVEAADKTASVYFCEEYLLLDYISHEFFHVAYRIAIEHERTYEKISESEEYYATLHGELVAQFYNLYAGLPSSSGILLNDKFISKSCKEVNLESYKPGNS